MPGAGPGAKWLRHDYSPPGRVSATGRGRLGRNVKEERMNVAETSLRMLVEKWLAPTPAMPARIARFSRMTPDQRRYVCVESLRPGGTLVIFFFRHDDRSWRVFPPAAPRPAMKAC